jgi:hypothetical protein
VGPEFPSLDGFLDDAGDLLERPFVMPVKTDAGEIYPGTVGIS